MTRRKAITPAMKIACLLNRAYVVCLCGNRVLPSDKIEWDHTQALVHEGEHDYTNIRPLHVLCHLEKTKLDIKANAKVKRLQSPRKSKRPMKSSGRKLQSRPFRKKAA